MIGSKFFIDTRFCEAADQKRRCKNPRSEFHEPFFEPTKSLVGYKK